MSGIKPLFETKRRSNKIPGADRTAIKKRLHFIHERVAPVQRKNRTPYFESNSKSVDSWERGVQLPRLPSTVSLRRQRFWDAITQQGIKTQQPATKFWPLKKFRVTKEAANGAENVEKLVPRQGKVDLGRPDSHGELKILKVCFL